MINKEPNLNSNSLVKTSTVLIAKFSSNKITNNI